MVWSCVGLAWLFWCALPQNIRAQELPVNTTVSKASQASPDRVANCRIVFLSFVGALESPQNKWSGVVQIGGLLKGPQFADVCAKTYSPYVWTDGRDWLLSHFPSHGGTLTAEELKEAPRVVLVGHSMGGWAIISVARDLRARGIPVELTVQVDSVGITDLTVPSNVRLAAIFHANDVLTPLTTKRLKLEDASRTQVVANVLVKHAGHESITRDPRIRELVLRTIEDLQGVQHGIAVEEKGTSSKTRAVEQ